MSKMWRLIVEEVCAESGLTEELLCSPRRSLTYSIPRQMVMFIAYRLCPEIGSKTIAMRLGRKDHTTALHGIMQMYKRLRNDEDMYDLFCRIEKRVLEKANAEKTVQPAS